MEFIHAQFIFPRPCGGFSEYLLQRVFAFVLNPVYCLFLKIVFSGKHSLSHNTNNIPFPMETRTVSKMQILTCGTDKEIL